MLSRRTPMRRVGFKRQGARLRIALDDVVLAEVAPGRLPRVERWLADAPAPVVFNPQPKDEPIRCEDYRRAVASLPCFRCGLVGFSQAAHADQGKGLSIKACDLTCFPLCGTRLGAPGCHFLIGSAGLLNRGERRALELRGAEATQATLIAASAGDPHLCKVLARVGLVGPL